MKKIIITCWLILTFFRVNAQSEWAQGGGGIGNDEFSGIVYDHSGNVYTTGYFMNAATFGNTQLDCTGSTQGYDEGIFLNKYNSHGTLQWSKVIAYVGAYSVTLKPIVIVGNTLWLTGGTIGFEDGNTINSYNNVYIIQTDLDGNSMFAKAYGNSTTVNASALAIANDFEGNIYLAGKFAGTIDFDNFHLSFSGSAYTQFFVRISARHKKALTAVQNEVAINGNGRGDAIQSIGINKVIMAGFYQDSIRFQNKVLVNTDINGFYQPFIAAFDTLGNCSWISGATGEGTFSPYYGFALLDNVLYVVGTIDGPMKFGGTNLTNSSSSNMVLAAYDYSSGNTLWAKELEQNVNPAAIDFMTDIHVAGKNLLCTGVISDTAYIGQQKIVTVGLGDVFIGTFDKNGNMKQYTLGGGKKNDQTYQTQFNPANGNIYVSGWFDGTETVFNGQILHNQGPANTEDVFFWVLNERRSDEPLDEKSELQPANNFRISLFPNPASDFIQLVADQDEKSAEIILMDASGKVVYSSMKQQLTANIPFTIDSRIFSGGIYFLRVKTDTMDETQKVVLSK